MARGGGARVSVSSGFRGAESEGERGESEGAVRGARPRPYPLEAVKGGEGSDRGELARSLQRAEEDDPGRFSSQAPGSFAEIRKPVLVLLFFCSIFITCSNSFIWGPK